MHPPLSWHPLWVTLCLVILFVLSAPANGWLASAIFGLGAVLFHLAWAYQARAVLSTNRSPLLYALPIVCMALVAALMSALPDEQRTEAGRLFRPASALELLTLMLSALGVATYFAALWATASSIEKAEAGELRSPPLSTIGTFLALAILPIAVWWLHGRVKQRASVRPL